MQRSPSAHPHAVYFSTDGLGHGERGDSDTLIIRVELGALEKSRRTGDDDYFRGVTYGVGNLSPQERAAFRHTTRRVMWAMMEARRMEWRQSMELHCLAYFGSVAPAQFSAAVIVHPRSGLRWDGDSTARLEALALAFDFSREIPGIERYDRAAIHAAHLAASKG